MNHLDYRIDEGAAFPLRKRNVPQKTITSSTDFPALRNYNKLVVDFTKLATNNNEAKNHPRSNHEIKSTDTSVNNTNNNNNKNTSKDANLIYSTLTSGNKAVHPTSTATEQQTNQNNRAQPFLIKVF